MKRLPIFLLLVCISILNITSIHAAVAPPEFITVQIQNCGDDDYSGLHADVLVPKPVGFNEVYNQTYTEQYPLYDSFGFLVETDRVSYRAFIEDDYYAYECELIIPLNIDDYTFFEVVVFETDGTVLGRYEVLQSTLLDYEEDGLYPVFTYDPSTNSVAMYTTEPNANMGGWGIFAAVLYIILGLAFVLTVVAIGLIGNKTFKQHIPPQYIKPYKYIHWLFQPIMIVTAIIGMFSVYGILSELIILLLLIAIETIEYIILRNYIRKDEHLIEIKYLTRIYIFTLVYTFFIWLMMSGIVM